METPPQQQPAIGFNLKPGIVWGGALLLLALLFLPAMNGPCHNDPQWGCRNNLKWLAIAMHNYHDVYHSFPPAYIADKNGRPIHSWRVLLLPFLECDSLYKQYRFDEPWNGPHNKMLAAKMPDIFHCPSETGQQTTTSYFAVVGPKTVFPGEKPIKIRDITDGTSSTILLVEAADSGINWLEPRDMSYVEAVRGINPKSGWGISSHHEGGARVALASGATQFLPNAIPAGDLRLLLERNDGDSVLPIGLE
jgi:hypothetical protein